MQARLVYRNVTGMNDETTPLVYDYVIKNALSKIGYRFDPDELTDFEVDYLTKIQSVFGKLEEEDLKKQSRKNHGK